MKILKRILLAMLVLLVVAIAAGFTFIRHLNHRALPDYNAGLQLRGLHAPVEVYRDSFAIPHVYASDEHDLYMAVGYLMAQDRLWQMDMLRHVTEGRLSEIFGEGYIDTDLLLRALRYREKSEKILEKTDPEAVAALQAFSEGINQYIEDQGNRLPPEFAILKYRPEKWEPYHSLNMIGYMGWDLKTGWSEILLNTIQQSIDSVRYRQLLPDLLREQPVVYPGYNRVSSTQLMPDMLLDLALLHPLGADVLEASNNWAVSGSKSSTGMPLLANDMHLSLSVPGIWYQMHQVVEGKLNVTGLALPGTPLIICGHNDSIAWGMTNTSVDNVDFYEERVNPADSTQYEYNGTWRNFAYQKTVIQTSTGRQVEKMLRFSHRGPIVSSFKKIPDKVISLHWVGEEMSDEFRTVFLLNRANNWDEFKAALTTFTSISQNVVYADRKGNIGLYCAAGIPVRNREIMFGMLPGQTDKYDWKGYVPFEELPYLYNPASGFVASANNRTAPSEYPYHIGSWYAHPSRYQRITELLSAKGLLTVDDFKAIQLDQHSELAKKYLPGMLVSLSGYTDMNTVEKQAVEILSEWNYDMSGSSPAAAVFEKLYWHLVRCTYSDELGSELFSGLNGVTSITRNATDQLIDSKISPWFDDVTTPDKTEDYNAVVHCAFTTAIAELSAQFGNDPEAWEWGKLHALVLAHPLSSVAVLDRVFALNRGPFPVGGSFHTVSPYSYDNNKPFDANHGASHRHIFDLSNWDHSLTVIPTGNSGIPASPHYCDQTELYINGKYHADYFSKEKIVENAMYHMRFR